MKRLCSKDVNKEVLALEIVISYVSALLICGGQALNIMEIRIGDVSLTLKGAGSERINDPCYSKFITKEGLIPSLRFEFSNKTPKKTYENRFDSPGLWALDFNDIRDFCIEMKGYNRKAIATIQVSFKDKRGLIYLRDNGSALKGSLTKRLSCLPFCYPVDQVIYINILPLYKAILLHACGIKENGKAYLFSGFSGAGKSTMAKQWLGLEGIKVLNDDRIIVRELRGVFYAYGTPWHGELSKCEPERGRLRALFIIRHGKDNNLRPLSLSEATSGIITRSFLPFWDKEGMEKAIDVIERLVRKVPCYELTFRPDRTVVTYIRSLEDDLFKG